ncbi:MAG TPA: phosphatase PAP2 family protein [Chthoniobacterales bacterium]|nr:phosphatase PAP2 family protein [Chthoniobacterales bacterium]
MDRRSIFFAVLLAMLLSIAGIFILDRPVAQLVHQLGGEHSKFFVAGTSALEIIFGITVSKFALGLALILIGLALLAWKAGRHIGLMVPFVGCTHFTARLATGVLKEVFHRLRPYEVLASGGWDDQFFAAHGGSFPSGHATHFWALFFPLAFLFPKLRIPLVVVPMFIAIARVAVNDHWLSDVFASVSICGAITLLFIWVFGKVLPAGPE